MMVPVPTTTTRKLIAMANMFPGAPEGAQERSTTSLEVADPQGVLERVMEEANLHRGSLREQDGYTIPFRAGGSVRIRVVEGALDFTVNAPTVERRDYIEQAVGELTAGELGDEAGRLTWQPLD